LAVSLVALRDYFRRESKYLRLLLSDVRRKKSSGQMDSIQKCPVNKRATNSTQPVTLTRCNHSLQVLPGGTAVAPQ
ncbi:MAG: hypothetical protein ACREDR_05100, partial [Blastocatellia bacterium]